MLENVHLFSGLSSAALAEIEHHGTVKSFRKNTIVINQDDETYSLYVILSGSVKVFIFCSCDVRPVFRPTKDEKSTNAISGGWRENIKN